MPLSAHASILKDRQYAICMAPIGMTSMHARKSFATDRLTVKLDLS